MSEHRVSIYENGADYSVTFECDDGAIVDIIRWEMNGFQMELSPAMEDKLVAAAYEAIRNGFQDPDALYDQWREEQYQ